MSKRWLPLATIQEAGKMDAGALILTLVSLVVGAALSVLVSRYYFKRSLNYRLNVYRLGSSRVLAGIDPEIRKELSITFRDVTVEQLTTITLLVANQGVHPIKDPIKPLTITLPDGASFVDASFPFIFPDGRAVQGNLASANSFVCDFKILNPDEYFLVKLLISGDVRPRAVKCEVTAENLPPQLKVQNPPNVVSGNDSRSKLGGFDLFIFVMGIVVALLGVSCLSTIGWAYQSDPNSVPFMPHHKFNYLALAMIPAGLIGVAFCLIGLFMVWATSVNGILPSRRKAFKVPPGIMRGHVVIMPHGDYWDRDLMQDMEP
jgi:hypothetical protein